jgi:YVTN family beta-propeller protein
MDPSSLQVIMKTIVRPLFLALVLLLAMGEFHCTPSRPTLLPGRLPDGRVRLPNGWMLSPAGTHLQVGELPLNMDLTPDERYLFVTNDGTAEQTISIIDLETWSVTQTLPLSKSWLGLRLYGNGSRLLASGGNDNRIDVYSFADGHASLVDSIVIGAAWPKEKIWIAGIDVDEPRGIAYATAKENNSLYAIELAKKQVIRRIRLSAKPYTCLVSQVNPIVYVSLWGGSAVTLLDRSTLDTVATIRVGEHPSDMVETPDGNRLFVANANHNTVSIIDVAQRKILETVSTALVADAPNGSTPNALAVNADATRLFVANADNNYLAVMDIATWGRTHSLGFIPTGWYPTSVKVMKKRSVILVASAKGLSSRPNPLGPNPTKTNPDEEYIGSMFKGVVSRIDVPGTEQLAAFTSNVYANSPYTQLKKKNLPDASDRNPIPALVGAPTPIKYVFYIIKENRTYDQVFGDMEKGNGDPSLCLFPDSVTPNHHALVRQFVLLDNIYADAEVSADGHNWSMGAYATDYVEKTWPTRYGGRGGEYDYEGGNPIVYPSAGYLWNNCQRNGVSFRTYGEFASNPGKPGDSATASDPSLAGHVAPFYKAWDLGYSDVNRVRAWMKEFDAFEKNGDLPRFQVFHLPNDHTSGTSTGSLTPRAYVAQNDLALGMLVERISHSRFWKESAIFVIEDDAQNGPDHVDAHRTVALVISPYCRHGATDSELYSTSSMVRTIELILGLPPLSQFDASSTPMFSSFTAEPDGTPYTARPARVDVNETNLAGAYGQEQSDRMNFTRQDAAPDIELNEIIWKSIRGDHSSVPAPVRSAFVQILEAQGSDD